LAPGFLSSFRDAPVCGIIGSSFDETETHERFCWEA